MSKLSAAQRRCCRRFWAAWGNNTTQLDAHVNTLGGADLASNVLGNEPTQIDRGNQILGGIFGSKDGSREVANSAAQSSGLAPELLKQMLPILVMLVAGHLTERSGGQQGGLGGILGSVLGSLSGAGVAGAAPGGGLGGGLGGHSRFGLRRAAIEPSGHKTVLLDQTGGLEVHEHLVATWLWHGDTFDGMTRERM
ncbi:DUF937 domain-containing protein [Sphingomonas sp. H160509]|uniref:DUF937 domain-containing protein n=1 Tax=Sphingomonas sp. H160509 TaxID=2955313 RepID=UPI0021E8F11B|nr:DUF937 domain-containing protein [Sphingomonas sp. H160509]